MSLERGRFGIEYKPRPRKKESSAIGPVVLVVLGIAAVSFVITKLHRPADEYPTPPPPPPAQHQHTHVPEVRQETETPQPSSQPVQSSPTLDANQDSRAAKVSRKAPSIDFSALSRDRPPKVRNLLLRLEEAEKMGNTEMAATTIETLRALPGEPAADLDDMLARRLGQLNSRWLFTLANRQWVTEVTVRTRETPARIAAAHGSTLSSLIRLNALTDADSVETGAIIKVMNHPRFSMTVHRRARYVDLHLNGKFFNRYDIVGDAEICAVGIYKTNEKLREQLVTLGLKFSLRDRIELETLIPAGAAIVVSET